MTAGAVLYVGDLVAMADFYSGVFDLVPTAGEGFVELRAGDWVLTLVRADDPGPTDRRSRTPIKLCFTVADLDALRALVVLDEPWDHDGTRRCDGVDPEGNVLQLVELR